MKIRTEINTRKNPACDKRIYLVNSKTCSNSYLSSSPDCKTQKDIVLEFIQLSFLQMLWQYMIKASYLEKCQ